MNNPKVKVIPKKNALKRNYGKIVVICGPMFAGKSEEALRQLNRLTYADVPFLIFKPKLDHRSNQKIQSRDGREMKAIEIEQSMEVFKHLKKIEVYPFVIAFDEAQFFDPMIVNVVQTLISFNITVIISGLDTDFHYKPFGPMGTLLAIADEVHKLSAICVNCGLEATRTYRVKKNQVRSEETILIGDTDIYEARCAHCHDFEPEIDLKIKAQTEKWIQELRSNFLKSHRRKAKTTNK